MGMYDDIVCKYPLPLPEDTKGYTPHSFQTKDFDCALDLYEIREDGTLWLREVEREYIEGNPNGKTHSERMFKVNEIRSWWNQLKTTQTIRLYDYQHTDGEYDYSIEFSVTFIEGILNKIDLVEFKAIDNAERKESARMFVEKMKLRCQFEETLRYRMMCKPYNQLIRFIFQHVCSTNRYLYTNLWKWERKLTI